MIYLGVDPGSRRTGIAALNHDGAVRFVQCLAADDIRQMIWRVAREIRIPSDEFAYAVEDQEYRHERGKGSPATIFPFAQVAGAAAATLAARSRAIPVLVPPMKWKGSVPKLQHHRRLLTKMGWSWVEQGGKNPYCVVNGVNNVIGFEEIKPTQWPEVLDAIGIALWLREKHRRESFF